MQTQTGNNREEVKQEKWRRGGGGGVKVTEAWRLQLYDIIERRLLVDTERLQTHFRLPPLLKDAEINHYATPLVCAYGRL